MNKAISNGVKIAVNGALGRMGSRIIALASESGQFEIAGKFDNKKDGASGVDALSSSALTGKGVIIDFSSPEGTLLALNTALKAGWGLVVGTTGLDEKGKEALLKASRDIPVLVSSNMSVGVNVTLNLLEEAAKKLPKEFVIEITEAHHRHKKDAPSGTALMLANQIADTKKWNIKDLLKLWKEGKFDERGSANKIGMKVIREGEIVGEHTVLFKSPEESIQITHSAKSRDIFVQGALLAAKFLSQKVNNHQNGLYTMQDALKIPS